MMMPSSFKNMSSILLLVSIVCGTLVSALAL